MDTNQGSPSLFPGKIPTAWMGKDPHIASLKTLSYPSRVSSASKGANNDELSLKLPLGKEMAI